MMFEITPCIGDKSRNIGKGFQITFANGWTASVQWGYGMYCSTDDEEKPRKSKDAEIAALNPRGELMEIDPEGGDRVKGWQSPDEVLQFLNWVAAQPSKQPEGTNE
jgi:hypothetical protein